MIIDPPNGKIPYRLEAVARQKENLPNRTTGDPETRCLQPGVPRAAYVRSPFQIFQNDRAVYIVYQDVHAYRIIYLDGSPHNEGLGYAMGDSRGHWEGNTPVADVTSRGRSGCRCACRREFRSWRMNAKRARTGGGITS